MHQYLFKQATVLCGHEFKVGVHSVSEKVECDPRFLRYVECGLIVDADDAHVVSAETTEERSKRLHARLSGKTAPKDLEGNHKDCGPVGKPVHTPHDKHVETLKNGSGVEASTKPEDVKPFSEDDLKHPQPTNPPKEDEKEESLMEKLKHKSAEQSEAIEKLKAEDEKVAHEVDKKDVHAEAVRHAEAEKKNPKVVNKHGK